MMIAGIRIEVGPSGLNHDFAHDAGFGELVQRGVYRREPAARASA